MLDLLLELEVPVVVPTAMAIYGVRPVNGLITLANLVIEIVTMMQGG